MFMQATAQLSLSLEDLVIKGDWATTGINHVQFLLHNNRPDTDECDHLCNVGSSSTVSCQ